MSIYNAERAWLMLADKTVFEGRSFGAAGTAIGEVVFTTAMTGCQETLTDPGHYGQIVVQTFPLIGNYGTNDDDAESDNIYMKGYIVREWCDSPSNFRAKERIDLYLKKHNAIGLFDIDTRALTRHLREHGVMNGVITTVPIETLGVQRLLDEINSYKITDAAASVTVAATKIYPAHGHRKRRVALLDFGYKRNIRESLRARGCDVAVVPAHTTAAQLKELGAQGVLLSNGPGNPTENAEIIENLCGIVKTGLPVMGICLGHQLMALAMGGKTAKMHRGHRGRNQPVIELSSGRVYVTAQNHGYEVLTDSIDPEIAKISHINANDRGCEGIIYKNAPVFTVQFYPEYCAGPADTSYLFDKFIAMIDGFKEGE